MDEYQAFTADIIRKLSEILILVISTICPPKAKIRSEITWPHNYDMKLPYGLDILPLLMLNMRGRYIWLKAGSSF